MDAGALPLYPARDAAPLVPPRATPDSQNLDTFGVHFLYPWTSGSRTLQAALATPLKRQCKCVPGVRHHDAGQ